MSFFVKIEKWNNCCKYLFSCLVMAVFVLGFLYIYFMNLAVLETAQRNENLSKLADLNGECQKLEGVYINKLEQFDIDYAKFLGFVEAEPDEYVQAHQVVVKGGYEQELR